MVQPERAQRFRRDGRQPDRLADGSGYDVRWALSKYGNSYKVRDAMVLGFWMTPFLKNLFEDYIAKNGGNPRALTSALSR